MPSDDESSNQAGKEPEVAESAIVPEVAESAIVAAQVEPEIIWEDPSLALVYKPAGWLTVPGMPGSVSSRDPSVQAWLAKRWQDTTTGQPGFVGTVHRLDRPVSGVMVWARNPRSARRLSEQFASGKIIKQYWAVVSGIPASISGTWEDWLIVERHNGRNRVARCAPATPGGQTARTDWELMASSALNEGLSWFSLWPRTGRMHQLRVQSSERGWPIVGDKQYQCSYAFWPHAWKLALHARSLTFTHPETDERFLVEAAVEEHWKSLGGEKSWFAPDEKYRMRRNF